MLICDGCGQEFERWNQRGKNPKFCQSCREGKDINILRKSTAQLKANEVVDKLELMLKARGSHISQQKERW